MQRPLRATCTSNRVLTVGLENPRKIFRITGLLHGSGSPKDSDVTTSFGDKTWKKLSFSGGGGLQSIGPQVIIGLNRGEERLALRVLTDLAGSCKILRIRCSFLPTL